MSHGAGSSRVVVASQEELPALLLALTRASRVALDLEASGMFTYRARLCTLQLAWDDGERFAVVDTLSVPAAHLQPVLGPAGPVKIVHDVAFDARLLAEADTDLTNVHDTAIAARMLGRTATGLASLLESELGVRVSKDLQHHDWRIRPVDAAMLAYLRSDVAHLEELERALWGQVLARGIEQEVVEETLYRIASARAAARTPLAEPAYRRIRGVDRASERELAVLRVVAELREQEAARRDVPPHQVAPNEALLAIARARPRTAGDVGRVRGISLSTPAARAFAAQVAVAVESAGDRLPDEERALREAPRPPAALVRLRREREARLMKWRRAQATLRGVDEQVVLPGHCVKDATEDHVLTLEDLARVPGIGVFRVERDGPAMLDALRGRGEPS